MDRSGSRGAAVSLETSGSSISKPVLLLRCCFWREGRAIPATEFLQDLKKAFEAENRVHPRTNYSSGLDVGDMPGPRFVVACRSGEQRIFFTLARTGPSFSGAGSEIPQPTQGKTLTVLEVDDLFDPISKFDEGVQTLGLAMKDPEREEKLASAAARRGVDRVVKLGRMHVFVPPWDGVDLIRPMVRMVRHVRSTE